MPFPIALPRTRKETRKDVTVNEEFFSVGQRNFALATIRNVEIIYHHRRWFSELVLSTTAMAFFLFGAILTNMQLESVALVLFAMAAIVFWKGSPRYTIAVDTTSGRVESFTSSDKFLVESIGQRLQAVLNYGGRRPAAPRSSSRRHAIPA